MAIQKISKGIAGAVAGLAVAWVGHFTGLTVPADAVAWVEGIIASAVAGFIGFAIVWASPPNRE